MRKYIPTILAILFAIFTLGLIILVRIHPISTEFATLVMDDAHGAQPTYSMGTMFKTGETVRTKNNEFIEISIGDSVLIDLDENTILEIKSLDTNNLRVKFGHGRILVRVLDNEKQLTVQTPSAESKLKDADATFIGYDFKHQTSLIPLFGNMETTIPLLNQTIPVTEPITISDTNPPAIQQIEFNPETDARAEFYTWTE